VERDFEPMAFVTRAMRYIGYRPTTRYE